MNSEILASLCFIEKQDRLVTKFIEYKTVESRKLEKQDCKLLVRLLVLGKKGAAHNKVLDITSLRRSPAVTVNEVLGFTYLRILDILVCRAIVGE